MITIYLVSVGEYSAYHIVAAFSTKEMAEKIAKQEGGRVEEYELDDPQWKEQLSKTKETDLGWWCCLENWGPNIGSPRLIGEEFRLHQTKVSNGLLSNDVYFRDYRQPGDPYYSSTYQDCWNMTTEVCAETEEAATKIATERFQAFIAKRAIEGKPLPRGKPNERSR